MAKSFRNLATIIKNGFKGIWRNKNSGFLSAASIGAIMLLVGIILLAVLNINAFVQSIDSTLDEFVIFLHDDVQGDWLDSFLEELSQLNNVEQVTYVSKTQARIDAREMFKDDSHLLAGLERDNPLPASIEIQVEDLAGADYLVDQLSQRQEVDWIRYASNWVSWFVNAERFIKIGGLIAVIAIIILSVFIISNVVKLGINNRQSEIEIMKYVGASETFIQWPFIIEGIFYSLLGSGLAFVLMYNIYEKFVERYGITIMEYANFGLIDFNTIGQDMLIIYLTISVGIGLIGSLISIRKYLRV